MADGPIIKALKAKRTPVPDRFDEALKGYSVWRVLGSCLLNKIMKPFRKVKWSSRARK